MNEYNFKPFDKVLVREDSKSVWCCDFYSHYDESIKQHCCISTYYGYCIPYEDNKHLLGTTDALKPKKWRAEKFGVYYFVNSAIEATDDTDDGTTTDDARYNTGNYFCTKEEAQAMAYRLKQYLKENK